MKTFADFLESLSDSERNYIASLDYEDDVVEHREQLDAVIAKGGLVDLDTQYWHPYEVIDLGKHILVKGHESAFAACNGIVLLNISTGNDKSNEVDWVLPNFLIYSSLLDQDLVSMIEEFGQLAIRQSEQGGGGSSAALRASP